MLAVRRCTELVSGLDSVVFAPSTLEVAFFHSLTSVFREILRHQFHSQFQMTRWFSVPRGTQYNVVDGEFCALSELIPWLTASTGLLALQHPKGLSAMWPPPAHLLRRAKMSAWPLFLQRCAARGSRPQTFRRQQPLRSFFRRRTCTVRSHNTWPRMTRVSSRFSRRPRNLARPSRYFQPLRLPSSPSRLPLLLTVRRWSPFSVATRCRGPTGTRS